MPVSSIVPRWTEGPGQGIDRSVDPRHIADRAWATARNVRFFKQGTRARKIDGFFLHDTTPGNEPVRLLWHYVGTSGGEILVRVGTTKAWSGVGAGRVEIASGLAGSASLPIVADQFKDLLLWTDGEDRVKVYAGGGAGSVVDLAGFTNFRSKIVVAHKQHAVHFNTKEGAVETPWRAVYSAVGVPTDYTSDTAGDLDFLESRGGITAAQVLGDVIIVHKGDVPDGTIHRMTFVGSPDEYVQDPIPADDAAISRRACQRWGAFQYFMGGRNFYRLGAFPEPIGDKIWPEIMDELGLTSLLDYAQRHMIFSYRRPEWQEIHWAIPQLGAAQPNLIVIYNVRDNTWSIADHAPGLSHKLYPATVEDSWDGGVSAPIESSPDIPWDYVAYTQALPLALFGQVDGSVMQSGGNNANGVAISAFLESKRFSEELTPIRINEIRLLATGVGHLTCRLRAWMHAAGTPPAYDAGASYDLATGELPWVDALGYGRAWQVRFEQAELDSDFEIAAFGPGVIMGGGIR